MTSPHGAGGSAPATLTCEGPRRRALSQRGAQFTSGRGRRRPVSFDEPGGEPLTNARARRSSPGAERAAQFRRSHPELPLTGYEGDGIHAGNQEELRWQSAAQLTPC